MGVPSFFRNIVKEYSGVTFWENDKHIDHFFIDFNAMIYNVIRYIENADKMNASEFEKALLNRVIIQMERVICEVVKPRKSLLIAMDGPPPRAKMVQQRHRRYKGIKDAEFHSTKKKKYERSIRKLNWNKSAISPGTLFMKRLSDKIVDAIGKGKFNKHLTKCENDNGNGNGNGNSLEITFSDSSVPGEGEHKIMPLIYKSKLCPQDTIAVYSPDADMIVLSMITHKKEIFIFKENELDKSILGDDGNKSEFLYLSVDRCREGFVSEIYNNYSGEHGGAITGKLKEMDSMEISDRFLIDYSFLTFLCGNDFVISVPYLKMKEGGMDTLLGIYNELLCARQETCKNENGNGNKNEFLVNESNELNYDFFKQLVEKLADIELREFKKLQRKRDRIRGKSTNEKSKKSLKHNEFEPWKDDISRFEHEYYYSPLHPHFETKNKLFNKLDYYKDNWKARYNNHFFDKQEKIETICEGYLKSLVFCLEYYLKGLPSWSYYYPYRAAPTFTDLNKWMNSNKIKDFNFKFDLGKPFTPFEQLLLVLPKRSFGLLPKPLRNLPMGLEQDSFPTTFELDILLGGKYIYSEPILPDVHPYRIQQFVSDNLELLSENEKSRNVINFKPMRVIKTFNGNKKPFRKRLPRKS